MVAKHVNKKHDGKPRVLAINALHLLLLLQPWVWWLSIVNFNNDAKPPPNFARIWCITNRTPAGRVTPPWNVYMAKFDLDERVTGLADLCGSPHLSCKRGHIEMRDYMDRRVTPPKRVTPPTWGAPPSCKQALNKAFCLIVTINVLYDTKKTTRKKWTFKNMRRQFTQLRIAWVYSLSNPRG